MNIKNVTVQPSTATVVIFSDNELELIKLVITEKLGIFESSPNMWQDDQKTYKKMLKKISHIKINESQIKKWKI